MPRLSHNMPNENKRIKAVFLDLDGTLVSFATHRVPPSASAALRRAKEQGVLLFVATGRHPREIEQVEGLDFSLFSGYVTQNGQYCYTPGEVLYRHPMPRAEVQRLLEYLEEQPAACMFCTAEDMFINFVNERVENNHRQIATTIPPVGDAKRALQEELFQMVIYGDMAFARPYLARLPGCAGTCSNGQAVDVVPLGGGKEKGIAPMAAAFGLAREEVLVIGDGENDLGMMGWAGFSVAMGDGVPAARQAARAVCAGVDEDGIAEAFARFVL